MSRTISNTITTGLTLVPGDTPLTIANTGVVSDGVTGSTALYGPAGTTWIVTNLGTISDTGAGWGISFAAAGTVINAGSIAADRTASSGIGIYLSAGGSVANQSGGTIAAYNGIQISGAAGTVVNLGQVVANYNLYGNTGIYLQNGGTVINGTAPTGGSTVSSAYINAYQTGVKFGPTGPGTLINYGAIYGQHALAAVELINGVVINGPSGATGAQLAAGAADAVRIHGSGTVVNYGTIVARNGNARYYGVRLDSGGTIGNLGTASLI